MMWHLRKKFGAIKLDSGLTYIGAGNLTASILGALFWFVLASILATEDYGRLNYYLAIAFILSSVSLLGLNTTVITYVAKGVEKIRYQANLVVLFSNSIIFLLLLIFMNYLPLSLLFIAIGFFTMSVAELLGRRLYKKYSFLVIAQRASQIALSIGLYFVIGWDGILIGYAIAALIFSYRFFRSFRNFSITISELKPRFAFMTHSYSLGLSQSLTAYADKLIIAPLFGFAILGLYQLGFQFLMFLAIIPTSLYQYLLPQESAGVERRKVRFAGLVASVILSIIFFAASPFVIKGLFPNYIESIPATQVMSFGIIPMAINSIINSRLLGREKSKPVFIGAIIYLASLTLMLYMLGSTFGLIGLGTSVVISLSLQSISLWIMNRRLNDNKFKPSDREPSPKET